MTDNAQGLFWFALFAMLVAVVGTAIALISGWRRRREAEAREWRPEYESQSVRIEPRRLPDANAIVRIVPDPMDYRKAIKMIEGVPEDPFEAMPTRNNR